MFYTSLCSVFLKVNRMITLFELNNDILIMFICEEGKLFTEKTNPLYCSSSDC